MSYDNTVFEPSKQLLIKLASLIVHYEELTSDKGHELDKVAIDDIRKSPEVSDWMRSMHDMALLPVKRK